MHNNCIIEESASQSFVNQSNNDMESDNLSIISNEQIGRLTSVLYEEIPSDMSFSEFSSMSPSEKCKMNSRIRQIAARLKPMFPKQHSMFVLVAAHLLKNSHLYFNMQRPSELQCKILESKSISVETKEKMFGEFKEANRKIRNVRTLKYQNRIEEQKAEIESLRKEYGTLKNIADVSGIPVKTVYKWCTEGKGNNKVKKRVELSKLRRQEYESFLLQDTISFPHPCKKYSGKRYLKYTIEETRKIYLSQPEYHKYGILSKTRMTDFRPLYIKLARNTPLAQCLCQGCENCEKMIRSLLGVGLKGLPGNRFAAVNAIMCNEHIKQHGTQFEFAPIDCINGVCNNCGVDALMRSIQSANVDLLQENKTITWQRWMPPPGKKVPDIVHIKGSLQQGLQYFIDTLRNLSAHIFRSNWNHNIFEQVKKNLKPGELAQIFDFLMNFRNIRQDEVQPAFWDCSQTAIHVIINIFPCSKVGCSGLVTMTVCQITADLLHDSFVTRAAHDGNFKLLAEKGIRMETVFQFSDNCGAQYKSRRPFVELGRSPLNIIRVYFGERHGKNMCDGFFGCLKAWMSFNIKTKNVQVTHARDFFRFCKDKYRPRQGNSSECDHNPVEFQYFDAKDIRRHQDCDLDKSVPGTISLYSVRNTPNPMVLKVRNVPCLCEPCIKDNGDICLNYKHTDPWREVKLQTKKKLTKKADPRRFAPTPIEQVMCPISPNEDNVELQTDVIITHFEDSMQKEDAHFIDLTNAAQHVDEVGDIYVDLTAQQGEEVEPWSDDEDREILTFSHNDLPAASETQQSVKINSTLPSFDGIEDDVPEEILWESYRSALEGCETYEELAIMAEGIKNRMPKMRKRKRDVLFQPKYEHIDNRAMKNIPKDGPQDVVAIWTLGDGNCLSRALSRSFWGDPVRHTEVRTRIIIEGVLNKELYLTHEALTAGSQYVRRYETLPVTYSKYSDYYISGQVVTDDTVDYLYTREMHDCATKNTFMGLWQIAQAATVFGVPIMSVYPEGCDSLMRYDFNRIFYPFGFLTQNEEHLKILWTGYKPGHVPNHFVPLITRNLKYGKIDHLILWKNVVLLI